MVRGRRWSLLLAAAATLAGQQGFDPDELRAHSGPYVPPPPPNTLRAQVNLVEVPVVVRDGKHHTVAALKQSDFEIFDEGKKQTISAFSVETFTPRAIPAGAAPPDPQPAAIPAAAAPNPEHPPRYVVLCFDNLNTAFADLKYTKDAAQRFVKTSLAPGDLVTVVTTASPQSTTFTSDAPKLAEAIEKITPQSRYSDEPGQCPRITAYQAYVITNHLDNQTFEGVVAEDMSCKHMRHQPAVDDVNALAPIIWEHAKSNSANTLYAVRGLVDGLGKLPGRRMLLLASSGFLAGNLEYLEDELITRALHAEVVINTLDAKGLYTYDPGGRPISEPSARSVRTMAAETAIQGRQAQAKDDGMAVLALGTGGAFYHNSNDLNRGFRELGMVPEVMYVLGFTPAEAAPDGRFHNLKVKLASGNHYSLQARLGYSALSKTPPEQHAPNRLDLAVMASDSPSDVPARMTLEPASTENGIAMLKVVVHVDVSRLHFETRAGRQAQKLRFVAAFLDASGNVVKGTQGDVELALKQGSFERLSKQGFGVTLPLRAPPGNYTLRCVVEDTLEGKITATSQPVELK